MMNPELKTKWLKALRSGNYKQCQRRLRRDTGYCCLGVLCDVVDPTGWNKKEEFTYGNYLNDCYLPEDLIKKHGITHMDETQLSNLNDRGKSFLEIADVIEKTL